MKKIICKLCNSSISASYLGFHLKKYHNWVYKNNSKQYYDLFLKKKDEGKCKICKEDTKYKSILRGYQEYCSLQCVGSDNDRTNLIKKTKLEKYGCENYNNRSKFLDTMVNTLDENNLNKFEAARIKAEKTKEILYNDVNYNNRRKYKRTCLEKYGVDHNFKSDECKQKKIETYFKNWGVSNPNKTKEIQNKVKNTKLKKYGNMWGAGVTNYYSKISQELFWSIYSFLPEELKKYTYFAELNYEFCIKDKKYFSYDFVIKKLNLCIEFNGNIWHADPKIYKEQDTPNPFLKELTAKEIWDYDKIKFNVIKNKGFKLIIVWEDEYNKDKDKCIYLIKNEINNIIINNLNRFNTIEMIHHNKLAKMEKEVEK